MNQVSRFLNRCAVHRYIPIKKPGQVNDKPLLPPLHMTWDEEFQTTGSTVRTTPRVCVCHWYSQHDGGVLLVHVCTWGWNMRTRLKKKPGVQNQAACMRVEMWQRLSGSWRKKEAVCTRVLSTWVFVFYYWKWLDSVIHNTGSFSPYTWWLFFIRIYSMVRRAGWWTTGEEEQAFAVHQATACIVLIFNMCPGFFRKGRAVVCSRKRRRRPGGVRASWRNPLCGGSVSCTNVWTHNTAHTNSLC